MERVIHTTMGGGRRIAIPADVCHQFGLEPGTPVVLEPTGNGIMLRPLKAVMSDVQAFFADAGPPDVLLSEELVRDRREEAEREAVAEAVLDASALIAFLRNEAGSAKMAAVLTRSCISAVNLAEVYSKLAEHGKPLDAVAHQIERLRIEVVPFDVDQARLAASLWNATRQAGLTLADLACLGLALKTSLPAFTTNGNWLTCNVGVEVVKIR